MFLVSTILFAAITFPLVDEPDGEDLALAEQAIVLESEDEAEDGELIFNDDTVAELEDDDIN